MKRLSLHHNASRLTADGTVDLKTMTADLNLGLQGLLEDAVGGSERTHLSLDRSLPSSGLPGSRQT
ncbi:MAG: hypothetical protein M5R38_17215 [Candidatus Methylomirabilis sp.]|nr:hypothetical protein [Candidatus Methylomirabilis sp.]